MIPPYRPAWFDDAACVAYDPELWFPVPTDADAAGRAVAICGTCPVREPCLADAMATEQGHGWANRHGIWGGLSGDQRHALAHGKPRKKPRKYARLCPRGHDRIDARPNGSCSSCIVEVRRLMRQARGLLGLSSADYITTYGQSRGVAEAIIAEHEEAAA